MGSVKEIPASSASILVEGYCNDFIQLAASLAQTLEQVSMRGLSLGGSRKSLERVEQGMRNLSDAIATLLQSTDQPKPKIPPAPARSSVKPPVLTSPNPARAHAAGPVDHPVPTGETPETVTEGACSIQGTTANLPLTSVFQFLGRMRKTGTLAIKIGPEELSIELVDGCVESTASNRPPSSERVGNLLVEKGIVTDEQVARFLRRNENARHHIGPEMVRNKVISAEQLQETLEDQVRRRIRRAVASRLASYAFHDGKRSSGHGDIKLRLPLRG